MQIFDVTDPRTHTRGSERLLCYNLLLMLANRGRRMRCDAGHGITIFPETEGGRPTSLGMDPAAVHSFEVITREARVLEPLPQLPGSSRSFGVRLYNAEFVATLHVGEGDPPAEYMLDLEGPSGHDRDAQEAIERYVEANDDEWLVEGADGIMAFVPDPTKSRLGRWGRWILILLGAGLLAAAGTALVWFWR